jgi:hypothetical protein
MATTHLFNVETAIELGVDEAIIIEHLIFWTEKNKASNRHEYDGRTWTYNSTKAFAKIFPYWNDRKISHILNSLVERGVLLKGNYNKVSYDRTLWYAFSEESKYIFPVVHLPNNVNGNTQNCAPIPDINPDIKPVSSQNIDEGDKKSPIAPIPPKQRTEEPRENEKPLKTTEKIYGEFKNVLLDDEYVRKKFALYGQDQLHEMINMLSCWKESNHISLYKKNAGALSGWVSREYKPKIVPEAPHE